MMQLLDVCMLVSCCLLQHFRRLCADVRHLLAFSTHFNPLLCELQEYDFPACDLLLVMGTSLVVHPFASLIGEFTLGQSCHVLRPHTWPMGSSVLRSVWAWLCPHH
jgi:hypothetical protein